MVDPHSYPPEDTNGAASGVPDGVDEVACVSAAVTIGLSATGEKRAGGELLDAGACSGDPGIGGIVLSLAVLWLKGTDGDVSPSQEDNGDGSVGVSGCSTLECGIVWYSARAMSSAGKKIGENGVLCGGKLGDDLIDGSVEVDTDVSVTVGESDRIEVMVTLLLVVEAIYSASAHTRRS